MHRQPTTTLLDLGDELPYGSRQLAAGISLIPRLVTTSSARFHHACRPSGMSPERGIMCQHIGSPQ